MQPYLLISATRSQKLFVEVGPIQQQWNATGIMIQWGDWINTFIAIVPDSFAVSTFPKFNIPMFRHRRDVPGVALFPYGLVDTSDSSGADGGFRIAPNTWMILKVGRLSRRDHPRQIMF